MLVLSRKANQGLMIGDDIEIKIFSIDGDRVSIGIEAPKALRIVRDELIGEVGQENVQALSTSLTDVYSAIGRIDNK